MTLGELKALTQSLTGVGKDEDIRQVYARMAELGLDPGKLYQELEMTSPLVDTHRDVSYHNTYIQLHSHTFYELLYCCNSCGAEYLVGAERYRLQKGDIVFVPPGVSHRPLLPEPMEEPYIRYVMWLSADFMERFAALLGYAFTDKQSHAGLLRTAGTKWEHLGDVFQRGVQEAERKAEGWEAAVVGNTITLLTLVKRATDDRAARMLQAEQPELLDRIVAYVETHYHQNITIGMLAREFYVSSSTVSHLFKQRLGISLYRFVTQRRLIAAKSRIEKGELLERVALQTGFQDYSVFYRAFRQEYGISPRQYRQLQVGKAAETAP